MDEVTRRIRGDKRHDLSPAMVRALKLAADGDTRLNYMPHKRSWASVQGKHVASTTLHALEHRGYLSPCGKQSSSGWPRPRKLTQKAHGFLAHTAQQKCRHTDKVVGRCTDVASTQQGKGHYYCAKHSGVVCSVCGIIRRLEEDHDYCTVCSGARDCD